MNMDNIRRRVGALEAVKRVVEDPRLNRTKAERDAAVVAVLNDPDRVREIMADFDGAEWTDRGRRAAVEAAMRANA